MKMKLNVRSSQRLPCRSKSFNFCSISILCARIFFLDGVFFTGNGFFQSTITDNIKKCRNKMDVSQDRLSKLADVTYNNIIKIESVANKNPTIEILAKIAKAFDVNLEDLMK